MEKLSIMNKNYYKNPVIRGFTPDPSICRSGDTYYLVCSSFQYFPGIPIFESKNLINWKQIGHALTRKEQLPLSGADSSGGIYAPTIRYHNGRFYIVTTNVNGCGNFLIWTDDIYGEWSDVIPINRDGIDPSLYFEGDKTYFMSNHGDPDGMASIMQCEINLDTGEILTEARCIWRGCGGRYLEGPHLYKIEDSYYLLAAEGGTEYGHMEVIARSKNPYGPFETPAKDSPSANPILTNRNLGGYPLQGTGHADLIQDKDGNWWMVLLAFRQIGQYITHHHIGRETCLVPVYFTPDGWITAGENGTVQLEMEPHDSSQKLTQEALRPLTFKNTLPGREWVWLRNPELENYRFWSHTIDVSDKTREISKACKPSKHLSGTLNCTGNVLKHTDSNLTKPCAETFYLRGTGITLDNPVHSPTFIGIRQQELYGHMQVTLSSSEGEAGITIYMDQTHHYDLALLHTEKECRLIKRRTIGDMQYIQQEIQLPRNTKEVFLEISMEPEVYSFKARLTNSELPEFASASVQSSNQQIVNTVETGEDSTSSVIDFGTALTRYLSSETAGGFTGVMLGLYAVNTKDSFAEFSDFIYTPIQN